MALTGTPRAKLHHVVPTHPLKNTFCLIELLGIGPLRTRAVQGLSGGERQRAAIARALVTKPACILADEPTGNLDEKTSDKVFDVMLELNQEYGTSLLMVTHNLALASRLDETYELRDGVLHEHS